MQKNKLTLAVLCAAGLTLAACGSGNAPASNNNNGITKTTLTAPAGFSPIGAAGSSDVVINLSAGQVAWPMGTSFTTYTLPSDLLAALKALPNLDGVKISTPMGIAVPVAFTLPDNSVYVLTPSSSSSSASTGNSTTPQAVFSLSDVKVTPPLTTFTSNVYPVGSSAVLVGGINESGINTLSLQTGTGVTPAIAFTTPATTCPGVAASETITTVAAVTQFGIKDFNYLAIGTNNGSVCVFGADQKFANGQVQNLSTSAKKVGYVLGNSVTAPFGFFAATNESSDLIGNWFVGDQLYRVNGTQAADGTITRNSFLKLTGAIISGNNETTFANAPAAVSSTVTDTQGVLWAVSSGGKMIQVLTPGSTTWTTPTETAPNGLIIPNGDGIGAAAPSGDGSGTVDVLHSNSPTP